MSKFSIDCSIGSKHRLNRNFVINFNFDLVANRGHCFTANGTFLMCITMDFFSILMFIIDWHILLSLCYAFNIQLRNKYSFIWPWNCAIFTKRHSIGTKYHTSNTLSHHYSERAKCETTQTELLFVGWASSVPSHSISFVYFMMNSNKYWQ